MELKRPAHLRDRMTLAFAKMQATGNDFVVVDERAQGAHDWPALARAFGDRHFGIGSDGLLVLSHSTIADARMRMFNPDGSEDMCGNGLRCAVKLVATQPRELTLETLDGVVLCTLRDDGQVTTTLPPARFAAADLPALVEERLWDHAVTIDQCALRLFGASTGTPHVVIFETRTDADFERLSPVLETHALFPRRATISWVSLSQPDHLRARVWERAAGETLACGTAACAIAAIAHARGLTSRCVVVTMRGGRLSVVINADESLSLTGSAETVFRGHWRTGY